MSTASPLERRVQAHLRAIDGDGRWRVLRPPSGLDFSSNDYLGLSRHPLVKAHMIRAIHEDGCGSTGSRLLRGHREAFDRLERAFAAFKGTERALYFSSGYLANLAVLTTFVEPGDVVLSDRLNHASLRDGIRLSRTRRVTFPHGDAAALVRLLQRAEGRGQAFVVTESLFSMDGDVAPLVEYAAACRSAGAALIVDEAHAVGIYGARGRGLVEDLGVSDDVFVTIDTAGKALGVAGAFVSGPAWAIEYLVQRARPFMFSTAPPVPLASALEGSLAIVAAEPERRGRLRERAAYLRARLAEAGVSVPPGYSQIVPILLGDTNRACAVAAALQSDGFDVRAIRPPSVPVGTARLRVSVNVDLARDVLDRFVETLARVIGSG
jgi:8-amino-7-oxononanoate synthase